MFKENLMSALKRAVDLHNSGSGDNEAVIKSASEYSFNPDQTQRLVETYNTAKTICFYKTADDRSQKFNLADGGAVAKDLFKDSLPVKHADTIKLNDYSCYDEAVQFDEIGTSWVLDEVKAAETHERNMELFKANPANSKDIFGLKVGAPVLNEHQLESKLKEIDNIKMAASKAADAALMVDFAYGDLINDISRMIGLEKIADAVTALELQPCSDMSAQVLDDVIARFPGFDKKAERSDFTLFDVENPEIMAKYAEACDYFIKYAMFRASQAELECAAEKMANVLCPPAAPDASEFFTSNIKDMLIRGDTVKRAEDKPSKGSSSFMDPLGVLRGGISQGVQSSTKGMVTGAIDKSMEAGDKQSKLLTDKAKNLHRKFILEKMITTDPILKGIPEEDVIRAYQSIVSLAPEVSLNEEVTRSILRTATNAASISPYDAKSLVDLDLEMVRSQLVQQGGKKKELKDLREAGK